jgi:uncharacterized protein (TIGR00730 family)
MRGERVDPMSRNLCVFCSSSERVVPAYFDDATALGRLMAARGWSLVFGGGTRGLMGAVARGIHEGGGHVTAIIPERLNQPGVVYQTADEIIVTETLRERKAEMDRRADAFIALAGGFGTLEELLEAITLKQLGYHNRPVVLLNTRGFYDSLVALFHQQVREDFVHPDHQQLYTVAATPEEALDAIAAYEPPRLRDKLEPA